ncbi:MAG: flavin reductase family protein [Candidatus Micrarchaeia archaeon]
MEDLYHLLYPIRTLLISARYGEKESVMAADWCTPLSFEPKLFGVAVGKKRFTHSLIVHSKSFAINLVSPEMKEKMIICGTKSGKDIDKFRIAGLGKEEGKLTVLVSDSPASIECRVIKEIDVGDHTFFVGEVVNSVIRRRSSGLYHLKGLDFIEIGPKT